MELLYGALAGKVALNAILLYTTLKSPNIHSKYVIYFYTLIAVNI
jgi:hypothetical protein